MDVVPEKSPLFLHIMHDWFFDDKNKSPEFGESGSVGDINKFFSLPFQICNIS